MKIIQDETIYLCIEKRFEIKLSGGRIARVYKYLKENNDTDTYENDYEITNEDDLDLTEDERDKLVDFILEISLLKLK